MKFEKRVDYIRTRYFGRLRLVVRVRVNVGTVWRGEALRSTEYVLVFPFTHSRLLSALIPAVNQQGSVLCSTVQCCPA